MFAPPRALCACFVFIVMLLLVFLRLHASLDTLAATAVYDWKIMQGRISNTADNNEYLVSIRDITPPRQRLQPTLPDISEYTIEEIAAKAPAFQQGRIVITSMKSLPDLKEFSKDDGRIQQQRLAQMTVDPEVILIQTGAYDLPHLYEEIKALSKKDMIRKEGNKYLLRYPLMIANGAALTISGKDMEEMRLSQEAASFISNSGALFILHAKMTGWSEKQNKPAPFQNKNTYRPFITSWSGSQLFIADSLLSNLGCMKNKSYGVSYASCRACLGIDPELKNPTGAVVGSTFTGLYYGFYSYEAADVAIIGNTYADSIVYGIDSHDRSHGMLIAKNEIYGSRKKHGIIVSREVGGSWIFGNNSHDNAGTGIMIDRASAGNIIAGNISAHNKGDGIALFESQNSMTWANNIYGNARSGIRLRNSWNVKLLNDRISDNGKVPIVLYTSALEKKQPDRDVALDPYIKRSSASIEGTIIKTMNGKPAIKMNRALETTLSDIQLLSNSPLFSSQFFQDEQDILAHINTPDQEVVIARKTSLLKFLLKVKNLASKGWR
jgi:poly(beta-D-mannuronate) C5 epimerase